MTNGEMIQEMFPNIEITEITDKLVKYVRVEIKDKDNKKVSSWVADIDINWWNAECDKSTIGDCVSRAYLCNRIKGIDHDEDYECDEFGGSKITYHTCDWDEVLREIEDAPTVTPQEPKWIPVSERLPDTDDEVLCWYEYYHWSREKVLPEYGLGSYFKETESWFGEVANGHKVRVIAWIPLPKPYIEVEV